MSSDGPRTVGLVVEADGDARTARRLVDRVLLLREWVTEELLDSLRTWRGIDPESPMTHWKKVKALCREHGVKVHGKFGDESGKPDARAARRALLLFKKLGLPDAIVLVRDADDQPERLDGLRQARAHGPMPEQVAIGVAVPEREAWILAAIDSSSPESRAAAAAVKRDLGFDPTREPHRLGGSGKRDAKDVLGRLEGSGAEREHALLSAVPWGDLRQRGGGCGLTAFLDDVEQRVASVLV